VERDVPPSDHPWPDGTPVEVRYRCPACGPGPAARDPARAPVDDADRALARLAAGREGAAARHRLRARFPIDDGAPETAALAEAFLDLHSPRQLAALAAILEAIDAGLRAPAIDAALRFALLAAVQGASRLVGPAGRPTAPRLVGGRLRVPGDGWRERNPWFAFEAGIRLVRGVVQRLEADDPGLPPARFGEDLRALLDGPATVVLRVAGPHTLAAIADEVDGLDAGPGRRPPIRLALVEPPPSPSPERLLVGYQASAWALGRDAAAQLPLEGLVGGTGSAPTGWQLVALRRSLEAAAEVLAPDGRAVVLVRSLDLDPLVGAAVAASRAGYRLAAVRRLPEPERAWAVELEPSAGIATGPERGAPRPFSRTDALRIVVDAAVGTLKALGEPADAGRLTGPLLVALDRAGHLHRAAVAGEVPREADRLGEADEASRGQTPVASPEPAAVAGSDPRRPSESAPSLERPPAPDATAPREAAPPLGAVAAPPDPNATAAPRRAVAAIVDVLAAGLGDADPRRLVAVGDELWLADRADRAAAAEPLSDRLEWAVLTFLATAGPVEPDRIVGAVEERLRLEDPRDRALLRACLDSYAAPTGDGRLVARESIVARTHDHTRILARLVELGHALGLAVWLPSRARSRRIDGRSLDALLGDRERRADLAGLLQVPPDAVEGVDAVWYVRGRATFVFEVTWTAMLAAPVLRRGPLLPTDERTVRFLVLAPERRSLARAKLDRSAFLRATFEADNWHVLLWNELERFAGLDRPSLAALEPFLGLDPPLERLAGDQLSLFETGSPAPGSS
jgi:hypothetical protein